MASLLVHAPNSPPAHVELGDQSLVLGSEPDCDLVLDTPFVSGRHAQLELRGRRYSITDLGSSNPLLVNGERIVGAYFLHSGDLIRVGDVSIEFVDERRRDRNTVMLPAPEIATPRPGALSLGERHGIRAAERSGAAACVMVTNLSNSEAIRSHPRASMHVFSVHRTMLALEIDAASATDARISHDGAIAEIEDPAGAVRCAVAVMARVAVYNQEHPGMPLAVRIAISGDEPRADGAGPASEQLLTASSVVSRAAPLEILVTEYVRDAVAPLGYELSSRGSIRTPNGDTNSIFAVGSSRAG